MTTAHLPTHQLRSHHPGTDTNRRDRDRELVRHVARHGVITIEHAMAAQGVGRTAAYRRAASCIDAGLLERLEILRHQPSLLRATRQGLRYSGLDGLPVARVSPGGVEHALRCATVGSLLERQYGISHVLTERELAFAERLAEAPIAGAPMHDPRSPRHACTALHRPDFAVLPVGHSLAADGYPAAHARTREQAREIPGDHERAPARAEDMGVVAVEVELTPKSPRRLAAIIAAWTAADHVDEVHYLCKPGATRRAVERAVATVGADHKVAISEVPR